MIQVIGIRQGAWVQNFLTLLKIGALLGIPFSESGLETDSPRYKRDHRNAEKPAGSEQLAAGSNSDYKQTVGSWQWALGSKETSTREQLAKIRHL